MKGHIKMVFNMEETDRGDALKLETDAEIREGSLPELLTLARTFFEDVLPFGEMEKLLLIACLAGIAPWPEMVLEGAEASFDPGELEKILGGKDK